MALHFQASQLKRGKFLAQKCWSLQELLLYVSHESGCAREREAKVCKASWMLSTLSWHVVREHLSLQLHPKLVDRPGHSFSNSFQIDELMFPTSCLRCWKVTTTARLEIAWSLKTHSGQQSLNAGRDCLVFICLPKDVVLGFSWRSKLWQTHQGWQYSHAANGFGLSKKECKEYKWYQILIFVLDLARDAFHSILTSFALPGNTWPMMRRPPIWSLSYPLECRKTKKMQCRKGGFFLTRKARISEETGVIWWGVCPVLPTKRRGLQRPDRDLGIWIIWMSDRMSLDVVSTVSIRRPCNARVGAPSQVEQVEGREWVKAKNLIFPIFSFGYLRIFPFKQDIGTNKIKGEGQHTHISHMTVIYCRLGSMQRQQFGQFEHQNRLALSSQDSAKMVTWCFVEPATYT